MKRSRSDLIESIFVIVFGLLPIALLGLIMVAGLVAWLL